MPETIGLPINNRNNNNTVTPIKNENVLRIKPPYFAIRFLLITVYNEKQMAEINANNIPFRSGLIEKGLKISKTPIILTASDNIFETFNFSFNNKNASGAVKMGFVLNMTATIEAFVNTTAV